MKKATKKRALEPGAKNYHFWLPPELAQPFEDEAKDDDRSKASLFRKILDERYSK